MRYLPKSPQDRISMLADIGVSSIDDLFATIPAEYQLKRDLNIPRQHGESEIFRSMPSRTLPAATPPATPRSSVPASIATTSRS